MANITVPYFVTLFDEFKAVPTPKLDAFIDIASIRVPQSIWGARTKYATALLAAHMLTASGVSGQGSGGGAINNESVGDLSRGFAKVGEGGSGDEELQTTRYGIDFVALRREIIASATVTGSSINSCGPIGPGESWCG